LNPIIREKLKEILHRIPEPIVLTQNGKIKWANDSLLEINSNHDNSDHSIEGRENTVREINKAGQQMKPFLCVTILKSIVNKESNESLLNFVRSSTIVNTPQVLHFGKGSSSRKFELISTSFNYRNDKSIMYLLKDLTNFEKFKEIKAKQKFERLYFASITHDFRTPLSIISGNSELLLDSEDNPEKRKLILGIFKSASMLSLLVQDVLDLSQLKAGTLKIANGEFFIKEIFQSIVDLFIEKYENKGIYLNLIIHNSVPEKIISDKNRIKQVLMNLVSNALKFTLNGGVEIYVQNYESNDSLIQVQVQDSGVGIGSEDMSKLFTEFGRLDSHSKLNPNGVGLGLNICKHIVEKLGGNIEVESRINCGTIFTFTFCNFLSQNEELRNIEEEKNPHEVRVVPKLMLRQQIKGNYLANNFISKKELHFPFEESKNVDNLKNDSKLSCSCSKLLIVDDDYSIRNIMISFAIKCQIKFDQAENGLNALELVKEKSKSACGKVYKLIIIDYNMPIMNGPEAAIEIHNFFNLNEFFPQSSIVLLSGLGPEESNARNEKSLSVFSQVLSKPLSFIKFKELVNSFC